VVSFPFNVGLGYSRTNSNSEYFFNLQSISSDPSLWKRKVVDSPKRDLDMANMRPALEQGCGQQTPRASILFFHTNLLYVFKSKCKGEFDLGLCTTLGLAKTKLLRDDDFEHILRPNTFFNQKSPCSGILSASPKVVHRAILNIPLHFDIQKLYQIRTEN